MRALVFGAGRLGCGLVGEMLRRSGHEVVFVARNPLVAASLSRAGGYDVRFVEDGARPRRVSVRGVRCIALDDVTAVSREVATADLVATAVGLGGLPLMAPALAQGVLARGGAPLNVLTFENGKDPAGVLAASVRAILGSVPPTLGLAGVQAKRIVSRVTADDRAGDLLTFVADTAEGFVVDAGALVAPLPPLPGMRLTEQFPAEVRRKLSVFSVGHAAAAYLGALKGYRYVHAAVRDGQVRDLVRAAMAEGQAGVAALDGPRVAGTAADLDAVLARYANAGLDDRIQRVARDPLRKLAAGERLVGSALRAQRAGVQPKALAMVSAAALCYATSSGLADSPVGVLERVSGLPADSPLGTSILRHHRELAPAGLPGNSLLDLDRRLWAVDPTSDPALRGLLEVAA